MFKPTHRLEKKLIRALRARIKGDIHFDPYTCIQYSTAACNYRIHPFGVVMPKDGDDVAAIVEVAHELSIPLTARGAGVGLTGSALGEGLIIDFSRYMHRILSIDIENRRAVVEPGIVLNDLDRAIHKYGLFFPPDPSSNAYCTIGGMVANNAAGAHSFKYGATRQHVLSLSAILASGREYTVTRSMTEMKESSGELDRLIGRVRETLIRHDTNLKTHLPRTTKNSSGYLIGDVLHEDGSIDVAGMLAASEGTLALFTGIELALTPRPLHDGLCLLFFDSLHSACHAVQQICSMKPSMLEIMEDTFIRLVRKSAFEVGVPFPQNLKAMLLVEFDGNDPEEIATQLDSLERQFCGPGHLAIASRRATDPLEKEKLIKVRNAASPILNRTPFPLRPVRFIEDGTVPVDHLPDYILGLHDLFHKHDITGVIFGHAGDGNIHVNPFFDMTDRDFLGRMERVAEGAADLILQFRGSLSGEHGDGLLRTPYLRKMMGSAYDAYLEIKEAFDPDGILNPGKITGADQSRVTDNLRLLESIRYTKSPSTALSDASVTDELFKCSGCGTCRSYCPVFLATLNEQASPRAKVNLLMAVLLNPRIDKFWGIGPEEQELLNLCVGCEGCLTECPSGVDVAKIVRIAKHNHLQNWGAPIPERLMAATKQVGILGAIFPDITNRLLDSPLFRKAIDLVAGIDQRRGLPAFSHHTLDTIQSRSPESCAGNTGRMVYFPGCFAIYNDSEGEGAAILAMMMHHDVLPLIPQTECCGVARISIGDTDPVIGDAIRNVDTLFEYVQGGYTIVTGSPSCGLALRHHYPELLKTPESIAVAGAVRDVHEWIEDLVRCGTFDLALRALPYRVAIHQPCHLRAQKLGRLPGKLLRLIPGIQFTDLSPRCCGISGTYGMKSHRYDMSMRIGNPLFIEIQRIAPDLVISSCGTCRMQIEQATGIPTAHPVALLAESLNLLRVPRQLKLLYGTHSCKKNTLASQHQPSS